MSLNIFSLGLSVYDSIVKKPSDGIYVVVKNKGRLLKDKLDSDHISCDYEVDESIC